jgi:hypothetical protein
LLAHAAFDEISALLSKHLLVDRLFEAIYPRLREAQLHLLPLVLALRCLHRRLACGALR